ncbi:MAG: FtsX-like permease family protein, partial [Bacteroidota bacterium]
SVNKGLWNHNLKISYRVLRKNLLFSGINISGLVLGITAFFVLLLYYFQETSYDTFFPEQDKIYRIAMNSTDEGQYQESAKGPVPLIDLYEGKLSNALFSRMMPWQGYVRLEKNDKTKENQFVFADESIFDIFSFEVIHGSVEGGLSAPFQVVLTESKAIYYFGNENPVGKTLTYDEGSGEFEFNVMAVIEDVPSNTHLNFDMLASFESLNQIVPWHNNWFYPTTYLYAKFDQQINAEEVVKLGQSLLKENANPGYLDGGPQIVLQPVTDIHLTSDKQGEWKANNTQINVHFFLVLGIFILLIAIINYINLTTANSQQRTKEIGIKKAMGSAKSQLLKQFFLESLLMISFSIIMSVGLLFLLWSPIISQLLDSSVALKFVNSYWTIAVIGIGTISLAALAGVYPAFTTIRFNPVDVIRNNLSKYMSKGSQRKVLVTVQFSISMFLILFTMLLVQQYFFLQSKNTGFEKENRVAIRMVDDFDAQNYQTLKERLSQLSFVQNAAISSTIVGLGEGFHGFNATFPNRTSLEDVEWFTLGVDED